MRRLIGILIALLLATGCTPAPTEVDPDALPQLSVERPWVRTTDDAKDTSMTAAFLTIVNPGDQDVRLTSADFAGAGRVELHEMVVVEGKKVMQEAADGVVVPAGSHVHLTPGGYHIMLMQLSGPLAVGDQAELTLHFSDGLSVPVSAPVKEFVEEEDHYHSPEPSPTAAG